MLRFGENYSVGNILLKNTVFLGHFVQNDFRCGLGLKFGQNATTRGCRKDIENGNVTLSHPLMSAQHSTKPVRITEP